jgi:hypothetical protein
LESKHQLLISIPTRVAANGLPLADVNLNTSLSLLGPMSASPVSFAKIALMVPIVSVPAVIGYLVVYECMQRCIDPAGIRLSNSRGTIFHQLLLIRSYQK